MGTQGHSAERKFSSDGYSHWAENTPHHASVGEGGNKLVPRHLSWERWIGWRCYSINHSGEMSVSYSWSGVKGIWSEDYWLIGHEPPDSCFFVSPWRSFKFLRSHIYHTFPLWFSGLCNILRKAFLTSNGHLKHLCEKRDARALPPFWSLRIFFCWVIFNLFHVHQWLCAPGLTSRELSQSAWETLGSLRSFKAQEFSEDTFSATGIFLSLGSWGHPILA